MMANLKVLNCLEMRNRMDTAPYYSDFELVHFLDILLMIRNRKNGR